MSRSGIARPIVAAPRPDSAKPLYAQLRDGLRARIVDGTLGAGSRIPSESELIATNGVSRITVRQALNELEREGLIFRVHGKGTFVSEPAVGQDLASLSGLSESFARDGHDVRNRTLSLAEVNAPQREARRLGLKANAPVVRIETLRYLDRRPLSIDVLWVPVAIGRRLAAADRKTRDVLDIYENEFGLTLGPADVTIDATSADREQSRHLGIERGAPILHVERVIRLADGKPVHLDSISYRGDAFRYRLSVARHPPAR